MANGVLGVSPRSMKDTEQLQAMIDRGDEVVYVPAGDYVAEEPIRLRSGLTLLIKPGVSIEAAAGAFKGAEDSLFAGHECAGVRIHGNGAILRMRKADYIDPQGGYVKSEQRHIFDFRGATGVFIERLFLDQAGGDGVKLGCTHDERRMQCQNVELSDLRISESWRNGLSIVGASEVLAVDCEISGAGGPATSPQAAVDFEPNDGGDECSGILRRCRLVGVRGPALLAGFQKSKVTGRPRVMVLEDCTWSGFPWRMVDVWNPAAPAGFPHPNLAPGSLISINGQELLRV